MNAEHRGDIQVDIELRYSGYVITSAGHDISRVSVWTPRKTDDDIPVIDSADYQEDSFRVVVDKNISFTFQKTGKKWA